jgi:hypothetical protein
MGMGRGSPVFFEDASGRSRKFDRETTIYRVMGEKQEFTEF